MCLAAHALEFLGWTPLNVKLRLPPRQSRENSQLISLAPDLSLRMVGIASLTDQNISLSANCISRGVPDPTGVTGETVFTVLMMLPNPLVFEGLKVDCG